MLQPRMRQLLCAAACLGCSFVAAPPAPAQPAQPSAERVLLLQGAALSEYTVPAAARSDGAGNIILLKGVKRVDWDRSAGIEAPPPPPDPSWPTRPAIKPLAGKADAKGLGYRHPVAAEATTARRQAPATTPAAAWQMVPPPPVPRDTSPVRTTTVTVPATAGTLGTLGAGKEGSPCDAGDRLSSRQSERANDPQKSPAPLPPGLGVEPVSPSRAGDPKGPTAAGAGLEPGPTAATVREAEASAPSGKPPHTDPARNDPTAPRPGERPNAPRASDGGEPPGGAPLYRMVLAHLISNLVTLGVGAGLFAVVLVALFRRYRPYLEALRSTGLVLADRADREESPVLWPSVREASSGGDSAEAFDLGPSYAEEMRLKEEALRQQEEAILKQVFEQNVALCRQIGELEAAPAG
jgi:hypothetical protein